MTAIEVAITAAPLIITTVDGESRPARMWPGGAWDCPFCSGVNVPGTPLYDGRPWPYPCGNPACIAGGRGDPDSVAAIRLEQQRRREAESQRAWLSAWHEQDAADREQARQKAVEAFTVKAQARGWCSACWGRSTSWGLYLSRPRLVRHRQPANCPIARRSNG